MSKDNDTNDKSKIERFFSRKRKRSFFLLVEDLLSNLYLNRLRINHEFNALKIVMFFIPFAF